MEKKYNRFIEKMITELKREIKHQPNRVGELNFSTILPPHLCFLKQPPSMEAMLNDGIGMTLIFFSSRYPDSDPLQKLFEIFFLSEKITPEFYAHMMIDIAQAIIPYQRFGEKNNMVLFQPCIYNFGSEKIFFLLLGAVVKLSLDNIIGSSQSERYFKEQKNSWLQYANLASMKRTGKSVH